MLRAVSTICVKRLMAGSEKRNRLNITEAAKKAAGHMTASGLPRTWQTVRNPAHLRPSRRGDTAKKLAETDAQLRVRRTPKSQ
jgi:hypothetical protein